MRRPFYFVPILGLAQDAYLQPCAIIDSDHPEVAGRAGGSGGGGARVFPLGARPRRPSCRCRWWQGDLPGVGGARPPQWRALLPAWAERGVAGGLGWCRLDPRGDKPGIVTKFEPPAEHLAYAPVEPGEADLDGVFAAPLPQVVAALSRSADWRELLVNLPDSPA